jgi:site-specific recombinase XerD
MRGTSLRGFFSFLFAEGWLEEDLSAFVETPLIYRDASVPPHFTWKGIELLLASIRGETPLALRDRAMLILLCAYGLRGREVAQLTLEDIDWEHRLLKVRRKGGKVTTLPLMPVVEGTLSEYLTKSRPADAPYREILLTKYGLPFRQGCQTVRARLQTLVARAGLKRGRGVHAIRRAVGTRLVEQGWGAGAVAKIFDHESPDTVRIYLRLSLESLRDVAENYGNLL